MKQNYKRYEVKHPILGIMSTQGLIAFETDKGYTIPLDDSNWIGLPKHIVENSSAYFKLVGEKYDCGIEECCPKQKPKLKQLSTVDEPDWIDGTFLYEGEEADNIEDKLEMLHDIVGDLSSKVNEIVEKVNSCNKCG